MTIAAQVIPGYQCTRLNDFGTDLYPKPGWICEDYVLEVNVTIYACWLDTLLRAAIDCWLLSDINIRN